MGFDQVSWSPTVYDTTTEVEAGSSAGFSSPPTIAQLNASKGLNQIIGLANRRALLYTAAFGIGLTTNSYLANTNELTAAKLTSLQNQINAIRTTEGFASFSFTGIATSTPLTAAMLNELRQALRIAGLLARAPDAAAMYRRRDQPYGTRVFPDDFVPNTNAGKSAALSGAMTRHRRLLSYRIPSEYPGTFNGVLRIDVSNFTNTLDPVYAAKIYASLSDDHLYLSPAVAENLNVSAGASSIALGTHDLAISAGTLNVRKGSYLSLILGQDLELIGGGNSGFTASSRFAHLTEQLRVDFGA